MKNTTQKSGWTNDVRSMLPRVSKRFTVEELVQESEGELKRLHPENQNVRAKIRQQLQILRDNGELKQGDKLGHWEKVK